ncbi:MAG: hypothetical protein H6557_31390 [Lewinellaceae bacterium]|nr:hypothetical protein [Phaeodactylibacter sp.]MCB9041152.1 hypothetical protein [Lewinellaceae bacterium]
MSHHSSYADHMEHRINAALADWDYKEAVCEEQSKQEAREQAIREGFMPDVTVRNIAVRKFLAQNEFGGWRPEVFQAARDERVAKVAEPFPGTLYIETHMHVTVSDLTDILQFTYLPF